MLATILEFPDLQRLSGFENPAEVQRWADEIGLPVHPGRAGIWTTVEAVNHSLNLYSANGAGVVPYPADLL